MTASRQTPRLRRDLPVAILLLTALAGAPAISAQPALLLDLNPGDDSSPSSDPTYFIEFDGKLYFRAGTSEEGSELWRTDGTPEGTERFADIRPGLDGSYFSPAGIANGHLFFSASDGSESDALFATNGISQPERLLDPAGVYGTYCDHPVALNDVFYCLYDPLLTGGDRILKSDGTRDGTEFISPDRSDRLRLAAMGGSLYYANDFGVIYTSNGTLASESMLVDLAMPVYSGWSSFGAAGDHLFFVLLDGGWELGVSDGTAEGTGLLKDINASGSSTPKAFAAVGSTLYFTADDGVSGRELWMSDGTEAGTERVRDINPGAASSMSSSLPPVAIGSTIYFVADDGTHGSELWKSDGSEGGTEMVLDIESGAAGSNPSSLVEIGGDLYFLATDSASGRELWKSDGTPGGTSRVTDLCAGPLNGAALTAPALFDGLVYFSGDDCTGQGFELWRTDGTEPGTELVADIATGSADGVRVPTPDTQQGFAVDLSRWGDRVYFAGDDGTHGRELWVTDGTLAGTAMLADIAPDAASSDPSGFVKAGNRLFFFADDGTYGRELWSTDGTTPGTLRVADLDLNLDSPRTGISYRGPLAAPLGSKVLFFGSSQLWVSDGTEGGTIQLDEGPKSYSFGLGRLGQRAYFVKDYPFGLWSTDGTLAGTSAILDDYACCAEGPFTRAGSRLLMEGNSSIGGFASIWATDGTPGGTVELRDPSDGLGDSDSEFRVSTGDYTFFVVNDPDHGYELWWSDGTTPGTMLVEDIVPGPGSSAPHALTPVGDTVFFAADDGSHGIELWKSDGTVPGTGMVKDIAADGASSYPACLTDVAGYLYFAATDGSTGMELWRSDGTEGGTVALGEIATGADSSTPCQFLAVGGKVLFTAWDPDHGRELWTIEDVSGQVAVDGFESADLNGWAWVVGN